MRGKQCIPLETRFSRGTREPTTFRRRSTSRPNKMEPNDFGKTRVDLRGGRREYAVSRLVPVDRGFNFQRDYFRGGGGQRVSIRTGGKNRGASPKSISRMGKKEKKKTSQQSTSIVTIVIQHNSLVGYIVFLGILYRHATALYVLATINCRLLTFLLVRKTNGVF